MCRHWFDDIEALDLDGGTLRLVVGEPVQLKYLQRACLDQFNEAAAAVTGHLLAVQFVSEQEAASLRSARRNNRLPASRPVATGDQDDRQDEMLISPDYSFQHFVVGPGNRLAHAAAIAVSERPGEAYNPFFIHGGVGLGKTHLLQSICQRLLHGRPDTSIYYVSCESFTNQFLEAVQAGEMNQFRHRFRNVDVLVIDDIHFLSHRDRTQEEFFHTFNTLLQAGKQIILSSDAAPSEIPDLEERLVSRFNSGLVTPIEKPCYETRVTIAQRKAALRNMVLGDDVAAYLGTTIDTNVRELEGAITKLHIYAKVHGAPITLDLAKEALGNQPSQNNHHQPTIQNIIDAVTGYYDVKLTDLLSKKRHKSIALPRQVCMSLARKLTRYSLEEIGGYFGGRDHTTVLHAIKTIDRKRSSDTALAHDVARIEERLLAQPS